MMIIYFITSFQFFVLAASEIPLPFPFNKRDSQLLSMVIIYFIAPIQFFVLAASEIPLPNDEQDEEEHVFKK